MRTDSYAVSLSRIRVHLTDMRLQTLHGNIVTSFVSSQLQYSFFVRPHVLIREPAVSP